MVISWCFLFFVCRIQLTGQRKCLPRVLIRKELHWNVLIEKCLRGAGQLCEYSLEYEETVKSEWDVFLLLNRLSKHLGGMSRMSMRGLEGRNLSRSKVSFEAED